MKTSLIRNATALLLCATASISQAGTLTYYGPAHGNFNNVSVAVEGHSYKGGPAGGFSVNLAGFTEFGGTVNGDFEAYCVDVTEFIATSDKYKLLSAATYFNDSDKVQALGKLIRYVQGSNVLGTAGDKDKQSTALQLAIWNIVYDTDSDESNAMSEGVFSESTTGFKNTVGGAYVGAQDLLANAKNLSAGQSYDLFVLASGKPTWETTGLQDQIIWRQSTVPEPASLALAVLALGIAGAASLRRRQRV